MRDIHVRVLWARQLRSRGSESPSGPCASWRTQQPSIGCEGDNVGPDAHGRSAESPRWAWAGAGGNLIRGSASTPPPLFRLPPKICKSVKSLIFLHF